MLDGFDKCNAGGVSYGNSMLVMTVLVNGMLVLMVLLNEIHSGQHYAWYPCKSQSRTNLVRFVYKFYRPLTDTDFLLSENTVAIGQCNLIVLILVNAMLMTMVLVNALLVMMVLVNALLVIKVLVNEMLVIMVLINTMFVIMVLVNALHHNH